VPTSTFGVAVDDRSTGGFEECRTGGVAEGLTAGFDARPVTPVGAM